MRNKLHKLFSILLLIYTLVACNSEPTQTIEVTRSIPQTVEVTRLVSQTEIATRIVNEIITATPDSPVVTEQPCQPNADALLIDGGIVIVQYYTLLDYGLFEEAYQLLSSSAQSPRSLEDFVAGAEMAFETVQIVTVQFSSEDSDRQKQFYVEIVAEGEGGMSGSVPNGIVQHLWLKVIQENGEWRIDSFNTAPNP